MALQKRVLMVTCVSSSPATPTGWLKNGVIYTVAMGDYLCSNFIFPQRGNGKPTGIDVRKALIDYLKQIKELLNPPPSKLPIIKDTTFAL